MWTICTFGFKYCLLLQFTTMWLLILVPALFLVLVILGLIIYARWNFGRLEKQGIPVVQPNDFLLGGAMMSYEKNSGLLDIEHMKKYGPIFGLYEGRVPQIFICDAELIRLITSKYSDHFDSKRSTDFGDALLNEFPDFQPYEKWKTIRNKFSPVVNSLVRIKNMGGAMQDAIKDYINDIKRQVKDSGGRLEKYELNTGIFEMLTDLIARAQFGIKIGNSETSQRLSKCIQLIFRPPATESPWIATYAYAFPFIKRFLPNVTVNTQCTQEFVHLFKQFMDVRRKQNKQSGIKAQGRERDYLDFLIEWQDELKTNPEHKKCGIIDLTIYNMGLTPFVAANDQISLILAAMMVCVSENPEIEKKLQDEVNEAWEKSHGVFDHDTISEMHYLNACILEATRLYPFFLRAERVCTKDWEDKERGINFRKGDVVIIAIWAANRNPKYFENPEEFIPERFLPGNKEKIHPYAFTSFGFGPRNCVGKRLALEMMGIVAAYLIKELRFLKRKDTELTFLPGGPLSAVHKPILFDVET